MSERPIERDVPRKLDGKPLQLSDLPPATWPKGVAEDEYRWTPEDKVNVVRAIESGLITTQEAFEKYRLSIDEFISWREAVKSKGLKGLHTQSKETVPEKRGHMSIGPFVLFPDSFRITHGEFEVHLSAQEWRALLLLMLRKGEVVSHKDFKIALESENPLGVITPLHEKLSQISGGKKWIRNVYGEGWMYGGAPLLDI